MNYTEAHKKVQADKAKDNFMVIEVNAAWSEKLLLPHKDGMQLLAALSNVEQLTRNTTDDWRVRPLEQNRISVAFLSRSEYEDMKIAALLNVSQRDIRALKEAETTED